MKKIYMIRQLAVSLLAFFILIWAFFKNEFIVKIIISPFLICSFCAFHECLFLILNKIKIAKIFQFAFRISFFIYIFGVLLYAIYYAISSQSYSLFFIIGIFIIVIIPFFKNAFFHKK